MGRVTSVTPSVGGTASDASGLQKGTYTVNGGPAVTFTVGNNWTFTPSLNEGPNTVAASVTDNANNTSTQSITITKRSNVVFVRQGATGNGSGTSWENAYSELSTALKTSITYPSGTQIWVGAGTYFAVDNAGGGVISPF